MTDSTGPGLHYQKVTKSPSQRQQMLLTNIAYTPVGMTDSGSPLAYITAISSAAAATLTCAMV